MLNLFGVSVILTLVGNCKLQEMEDRENMVKHIWDVYTSSHRITLPKFWQEAFEAAYEDLISDVSNVRDAAISEIAKMSIRYIHVEPPPLHSSVSVLLSSRFQFIKYESLRDYGICYLA